jgi:transcriptional regulator with XRE-family HTH domain
MSDEEAKGPGGQPTKYDSAICEGFEKRFEKGQSILEVAVSLGVTRQTLYNWAKDHAEFFDALTRAREVSQAWWEKQGREHLFDHEEYDAENHVSTKDKFNDRLWTINVSRRFKADWSEKIDIEHSGSITINIDGDDAKL